MSNRKHLQSQLLSAVEACISRQRRLLGVPGWLAEHLACSLATAGIRKAHCYHPGAGNSEARLRMTNWFEGVSEEESKPRNILWREKCIPGFDKHAILYGQVYKSDSCHADWSRSQRHLNEARVFHRDNAKEFILESHPKYDWIRELFSMRSLVSWPQFSLNCPFIFSNNSLVVFAYVSQCWKCRNV